MEIQNTNETYLSLPDVVVFLTFGTLSAVTSLLIMLAFIFIKKLREQPGDIIFCISVSEFMLSLHWITSAVYSKHILMKNDYPHSSSKFCFIQAIISVYSGECIFLYNLSLSLYLFLAFRNILHQSRIPKKTFHVCCLGISTILTIVLISRNEMGKTRFGTCSLKATNQFKVTQFIPVVAILFYIIVSLWILKYVKKHTPECVGLGKIKEDFLIFYEKYVIWNVSIWLVIFTTNLILIFQKKYPNTISSQLEKYITLIGNIAKSLSVLVLTILRFQDPLFKSKLLKMLKKIFICFNTGKQSPKNSQDIELNNLNESLVSKSQRSSDNDFILFKQISGKFRQMLVKTTVTSICQFYLKHYNEINNNFGQQQEYGGGFPKTYKKYKVAPRIVKEFSNEDLAKEFDQLGIDVTERLLNVKITSYCTEEFNELIKMEAYPIDFFGSLDLDKNQKAIKKAGSAEGGKGGEFFVFTHDNNLMIKTISSSEKNLFLEIYDQYFNHFVRNPRSLISKIFGLFQIEFPGRDQIINIIIMRHVLFGISHSLISIEKVYDLKGSKYKREALIDNQNAKVLKDIDFIKIENKIHLAAHDQYNFIFYIQQDTEFFKLNSIIDYSLLVMKIKIKNTQDSRVREFYQNIKTNCIKKCSTEDNVYYHFGIVDYFQLYNTSKMAEKYFKQIVEMNAEIETSSQEPNYYAKRFVKFFEDAVLIQQDETTNIQK